MNIKRIFTLWVYLSLLFSFLVGPVSPAAPARAASAGAGAAPQAVLSHAGALVLVNSQSTAYIDFSHYIQPYLDHFGIPYTVKDIVAEPVSFISSDYAVIIIGHRMLDPNHAYLDAAEETLLAAAVNAGVGLVNFDNSLSSGSTPLYGYIQTLFGFSYVTPTGTTGVAFAAPASHYITQRHTAGETIATATMTPAGIIPPAGVTTLVTSGTEPILAVTSYGQGRAVQWGSYDWIKNDVKGTLLGLDDLVWRSIVWAARKPFVMQGMPPLVTMRMDDVQGPLWWAQDASDFGFIPWLGLFTDYIDASETAALKTLVDTGKATAAIHAFGDNFMYYNHAAGTDWSDEAMATNYTLATEWFASRQINISQYLVPHYYEIGTNAFSGLEAWGVKYIGTMMDPGKLETGPTGNPTAWIKNGPFRLYEDGLANDRTHNPYYADYMTIPGHPTMDGKFFNCLSEIRDITGYEWMGNNRNTVLEATADATEWLKRSLDSMSPGMLFSHEYTFLPTVSEANWRTILQQITQNIAAYHPIYVSMDAACQYLRAIHDSNISSVAYNDDNTITVNLSHITPGGTTDTGTKFYVFTEQEGGFQQILVDVPAFTDTAQVTYALPGPLDHIIVTPTSVSMAAGGTRQFSAQGYDASNRPIQNLTFVWSVVNGGGTIDSQGRFTAGTTTGTFENTVQAAVGAVSGTASVQVIESALDHFSFDAIPTPQYGGVPFRVTLRARDANNDPVLSYAGTAALSGSPLSVTPASVDLVNGVWTGMVTVTGSGSGETLSATAVPYTGQSAGFDVNVMRTCPCSIWENTGAPENENAYDGRPIEVGVKFRSEVNGYITGVRFIKGLLNTGTHTGHLWSADGTLLASVTFAGETASGWQQADFESPVAIQAHTTYVVSYFSSSGYFATSSTSYGGNLHVGVYNPPLKALAEGEDGANGVFHYDTSGFPTASWDNHAPNYWVDAVFNLSAAPDTTPPTVVTVTPANGSTGIALSASLAATFSEALDATTLTAATFELRDSANALVPAAVSYNSTTWTATLDPTGPLATSTTYTARLIGGASGVKDRAGNALASDYTWSFTTAAPPPDEGPGGPILVVASATNPFGRYYGEILRAEGLNEFLVTDISFVTEDLLEDYQVVILGEMSLTPAQVTLFSDWVEAGGNLIAMKPDAQLAGLLGLNAPTGTLSNAYLLVNTSQPPGLGIVNQTIQFHSAANEYALNGAASVATLYATASTATTFPAVSLRSVGANGGQAAAFAFDLARSVVYTRQGNPAWAGQKRDGQIPPTRSDDLFFGAFTGDPQPDWIDLNKVAIPQADEQQRLLANLIGFMNLDQLPLPRLWYFPRGEKAVVIMTHDDHGSSAVAGRLSHLASLDPPGCSLGDWECVRSSAYLFPEANSLTNAQAQAFTSQGFEIALHVNTGCVDWTPASLEAFFTSQGLTFATAFPGIPASSTNRNHCIAWSDWDTQAHVSLAHNVRLDTNYYYWPPSWVNNRPGMFTGSGMPMRFADLDGTLVDVYQAVTQMTDESGQVYPYTIDTLLDRALGAEGYYGAFTANMHIDGRGDAFADPIVLSAQARSVPVISGRQMLTWLDGRNNSKFMNLSRTGGTLSFEVSIAAGANGLQVLLPTQGSNGDLTGITLDGAPVSYALETVKGVEYAAFLAAPGAYQAVYAPDTTPPTISAVTAIPHGDGTATISWTTDEISTSRVDYGTAPDALTQQVSDAGLVAQHTLGLAGLGANTTYYYRVTSGDAANNSATEPPTGSPPASFTTPSARFIDTTLADFSAGTINACLYAAESGNGELMLAPTLGAEFGGTSLPSGWSGPGWPSGGSVAVSGGAAAVNGAVAQVDSPVTAGHVLEFEAIFTAAQYQNIGFGGGEPAFNAAPWLAFGTGDQSAQVLARINGGGVSLDSPLGTGWLGSPHRYRIEWLAGQVRFYIDGVLRYSYNVAIPGPLRVAASDYFADSPGLTVNWLRMSPYTGACSFTSRVFDAGSPANWGTLAWTADVPTTTGLNLLVRLGDTATPDGTWTGFFPVTNGGGIGSNSRYIQYRADFSTSDVSLTPVLYDVSIGYTLGADTQAPSVAGRTPSPDAEEVLVNSNVAVRFNEPMNPASITALTFRLRAEGAGADLPATVTYDPATFTASLNPDADLAASTLYHVTVSGAVSDRAGNPLGADDTWSFTTALPYLYMVDTTPADFGAGSLPACGTISEMGNGEVILAPLAGTDFSGSSLPAGWTLSDPSGGILGGGLFTLNNGLLAYGSATMTPGRAIEFVATFNANNSQHIGFGTDLNTSPWAIFSTHYPPTNQLFARSNGTETALPEVTLGVAHRFRIEWGAAAILYYVDGALVATHNVAITDNMRPVADNIPVIDPLVLDWLRVTPYATPCTFQSRVFATQGLANWGTITWTSEEPAGTSLSIRVRTGTTPTPDASWTEFAAVTNGADLNLSSRYFQYEAVLGTANVDVTPALQQLSIAYIAGPDTFPPAILARSPAPNATEVPLGSQVSVQFDEPMDPATITAANFSLRLDGEVTDVPATVSYEDATRTAFLVPGASLSLGKIYHVTVSSAVSDASHNPLPAADTWSFTTVLATLVDNTVAEFGAGSPGSDAYVTGIGDGEVTLRPAVGAEFSGESLPAGWSSNAYPGGGGASVSGGALTVNGALAATDGYYPPGRVLEFVATFGGENWQNAGFGQLLAQENGEYWALFGTYNTTTSLYARTNNGGPGNTTLTLIPGNWIGTPHRYRIEWNPDNVVFYIDGNWVWTVNVAITASMRPVVSDYTNIAPALTVDWLHMSPYATAGAFTSRILDAGAKADWDTLAWTADLPSGAGLALSVRTGNTPIPDATWSAFHALVQSGDPISGASRYLQYQADLSASNPSQPPSLSRVTVRYFNIANHAPAAGNDSYAVLAGAVLNTAAPGVLANDSDTDLDTIFAKLNTSPAHGALAFNSDGSFTYTPAGGYAGPDNFTYWASDGLADSGLATVNITVSYVQHDLTLQPGWNLVSFYPHPVSTAPEQLLAGLAGSVDLVYSWDAANQRWLRYDNVPMTPDTLTAIDEKTGFWIHITAASAVVLHVQGSVPVPATIPLVTGWNMVGFPAASSSALPAALTSHGVTGPFLIYSYQAVSALDPWKVFDSSTPAWANDLLSLAPGWGYWIYVSNPFVWQVEH